MTAAGGAYLYIFIAGVAATAVWRYLGLYLSNGLSEDSVIIEWVRTVSTALVAGLVARTVLFPPGALAEVAIGVRVGAFAFGVAVYFLARHHLVGGILAGVTALVLAQYALR